MKTKVLYLLIAFVCLTACDNFLDKSTGSVYPVHILQYQFDGVWKLCHNREIDITGLPNNFILEFRTTGITDAWVDDDSEVKVTLLDSELVDRSELLNLPFTLKTDCYLQRINVESNGESRIQFYCVDPDNCTYNIILVRKKS